MTVIILVYVESYIMYIVEDKQDLRIFNAVSDESYAENEICVVYSCILKYYEIFVRSNRVFYKKILRFCEI